MILKWRQCRSRQIRVCRYNGEGGGGVVHTDVCCRLDQDVGSDGGGARENGQAGGVAGQSSARPGTSIFTMIWFQCATRRAEARWVDLWYTNCTQICGRVATRLCAIRTPYFHKRHRIADNSNTFLIVNPSYHWRGTPCHWIRHCRTCNSHRRASRIRHRFRWHHSRKSTCSRCTHSYSNDTKRNLEMLDNNCGRTKLFSVQWLYLKW